MTDFTMPSLGSDMEAGTLVEWLVRPGDRVARGDIVAVVDTQKGAIDIEIFEDGVIREIVVPVGEEVPVGAVLARLDQEATESGSAAASAASESGGVGPPHAAPTEAAPAGVIPQPAAGPRASPRARRRARELGIDLEHVQGTGPAGAITGEDVERAAEGGSASGPSPAARMRQAIAAAMTRANAEIPHYYLGHTIDLAATMDWISRENASRGVEDRLLPIAPLLKAIALALQHVPQLNGHYRDARFHPSATVELGIAISVRGGGLVAPAIRDAAALPVTALMTRLNDLVTRARRGALRSSEMSEATVTVTNLGERGVESVFGVIYPPQVALVGIGTILERPWVVAGQLAVRPTVQVSLAADHRASDGHGGALFLQKIDRLLQAPESLESSA